MVPEPQVSWSGAEASASMVSFGVKDGKSLFPGATRRARPAGRITNDMDAEFKLHPAESFVNKKACVGFPRFLEPVFLKKGKNVDITLSNVASSFAIANGGAPLFFENPEVSMKVK